MTESRKNEKRREEKRSGTGKKRGDINSGLEKDGRRLNKKKNKVRERKEEERRLLIK